MKGAHGSLTFGQMSNDLKQKIAESLYHFCLELEKEFKFPTFICGGTFLGALRDKDFINHDDDIDVQYYLGESNVQESQKICALMCSYFKSKQRLKKWFAQVNPSHYHAWFENKVHYADVFSSWSENKELNLSGPANRIYRGVELNDMFPLSKINFRGFEFNAPKNQEKFAAWQWGKNWKVVEVKKKGYWPAGHKRPML